MSTTIDRPSRNRPAAVLPGDAAEPRFDAQRLDVYRVALEFQVFSTTLLPRRGQAALRDQLDRASACEPRCSAVSAAED